MDPHANQPLLVLGPPPEQADATIILIHGRGASAEDMLGLFDEIASDRIAAVAPQAAGHTWYPQSFLAPLKDNQPYLDSALRRLDTIVSDLLARGVRSDRLMLLGFSQGACLASEFAARRPRRYGAVIAFSGGLIGPPGTPRNYAGSFENTPALLASSDPDPHVPFSRVEETGSVFEAMGARVDLRRYPKMGHTVNADELQAARDLLRSLSQT